MVVPGSNRKNLQEIPKHLKKNLRFHLVTEMREVLAATLLNRRSPRSRPVDEKESRGGSERESYAVL